MLTVYNKRYLPKPSVDIPKHCDLFKQSRSESEMYSISGDGLRIRESFAYITPRIITRSQVNFLSHICTEPGWSSYLSGTVLTGIKLFPNDWYYYVTEISVPRGQDIPNTGPPFNSCIYRKYSTSRECEAQSYHPLNSEAAI